MSEFYSASDLVNRPDIQVAWLVQGIFRSVGTGLVVAKPYRGKTFLMEDLALSVCSGGKWMGHYPVRQGSVMFLQLEQPEDLTKERLMAVAKGKGMEVPLNLHMPKTLSWNLLDPSTLNKLDAAMAECKPVLVIIDSLVKVARKAEENSANQMADFFDGIKRLVDKHHCSFIMTDHPNKKDELRGSGEKEAFVDTYIKLEGGENYCAIIRMKFKKTRGAKPRPDSSFKVLSNTTKDERIVEAWVTYSETLTKAPILTMKLKGKRLQRAKIKEYMAKGPLPISPTALYPLVNGSKSNYYKVLDEMKNSGDIPEGAIQ